MLSSASKLFKPNQSKPASAAVCAVLSLTGKPTNTSNNNSLQQQSRNIITVANKTNTKSSSSPYQKKHDVFANIVNNRFLYSTDADVCELMPRKLVSIWLAAITDRVQKHSCQVSMMPQSVNYPRIAAMCGILCKYVRKKENPTNGEYIK